jgi:diguanylate cyclase
MSDFSQPADIAREALRRLALQRKLPTPDNYRSLYEEIAGGAAAEPFPERALKSLLARLPRDTTQQLRLARKLEEAVAAGEWNAFGTALANLLEAREPPPWSALIRELVAQLERRQAGLTPARKREALEHVLAGGAGDAEQLFQRLRGLIQSWTQQAAAAAVEELPGAADAGAARPESALGGELREPIAQLLERGLGLFLTDAPELAAEAQGLARDLLAAREPAALQGFGLRLRRFAERLPWVAEDQLELKASLLRLTSLIVANIGELVIEDRWLHGQIAVVGEAFSRPLDLRRIEDVERRMKEVIFKQSNLKKNLADAQERLKSMLASFVDHLAQMTQSTDAYHERIGRCAQRVGAARDIGELTEVIEEVMRETRALQFSAERSRDELTLMRQRAEEADREITRLQAELAQASEMVRHDTLTGALNRKGLEETLEREAARAARRGAPLCVALLDVDNFKALNDSLGHQAGDAALRHLAAVIGESLRPQDTVARYGGEEFVILLPETAPEAALTVMARLQRELTRRFFLHDNERILITFSAGLTQLQPGEERAAALARADAAMYEAKRAGKNRVVSAG